MSKSNKKISDVQAILLFLKYNVGTNTMISKATGISRSSICRAKRDLEQKGLIFEVERKSCKITGFPAWYLTANKELIQNRNRPC